MTLSISHFQIIIAIAKNGFVLIVDELTNLQRDHVPN